MLAASLLVVLYAQAASATEDDCEPLPGAGGAMPAEVGGSSGEALLVLPKDAAGEIPRDFELSEGARIAASRFSPVLCATIALIRGPAGSETAGLVSQIPDTALVVPNSSYRTAAAPVRPVPAATGADAQDPYRKLQYGLDRAGVDAARPLTSGAGVRVAVLDTAADRGHPDLPEITLLSPPGRAEPPPSTHGTLLAGIIGAIEHNGIGIAGIAPAATLLSLPICVDDPDEEGDVCALYDLLWGLDEAWSAQAQIVNLAVAGPPNPVLARAMRRLEKLGMAVVAAAGNEASSEPRYPAAYNSVIGVGALDRNGRPWAQGNSGRSVEIMAPGVEIVSTVPGGGFGFSEGTSLATAHVAGVLALLVAVSGDVETARTALFQAGFRHPSAVPSTAVLAPACDALALLGHPCP
jgi:subtilisin family serine protease